jgi:hypothetical protein
MQIASENPNPWNAIVLNGREKLAQNMLCNKKRVWRIFCDTIRLLRFIPRHKTRPFSWLFRQAWFSVGRLVAHRLSYSSILSLTTEMCKNGSMNRTDGMAHLQIMKMLCRHLLRAFRPAPFIHPFSRFSFLFSGKFLSSTIYTSTMGIRQLIKGIRLQRKLFLLFYASTSKSRENGSLSHLVFLYVCQRTE